MPRDLRSLDELVIHLVVGSLSNSQPRLQSTIATTQRQRRRPSQLPPRRSRSTAQPRAPDLGREELLTPRVAHYWVPSKSGSGRSSPVTARSSRTRRSTRSLSTLAGSVRGLIGGVPSRPPAAASGLGRLGACVRDRQPRGRPRRAHDRGSARRRILERADLHAAADQRHGAYPNETKIVARREK